MQTRAERHVSLQTYVLQNEMLFTDLMHEISAPAQRHRNSSISLNSIRLKLNKRRLCQTCVSIKKWSTKLQSEARSTEMQNTRRGSDLL